MTFLAEEIRISWVSTQPKYRVYAGLCHGCNILNLNSCMILLYNNFMCYMRPYNCAHKMNRSVVVAPPSVSCPFPLYYLARLGLFFFLWMP